MIKFFRHIRKSLINQNNMGKYFKYAIGEILLVVIGILIALQINNWNEARKTQAKEIEILNGFKNGLEFDISQLDSISFHYARARTSINIILEHLENDLSYSDSLAAHFFNSTLIYDSGGLTDGVFETLKSVGFDMISNKEILEQIILIYEEQNPWMQNWETRYFDELFYAHNNLFKSRFKEFWKGDYKDPNVIGTMEPLNYEQLKTDNEFLYYLRTQKNFIGWLINKPVENTGIECKKLLDLINEELKRLTIND